MPGNMYIPPHQRSNPFLNMGMNMLGQMAMAQMSQSMRAEEAAKERAFEEERYDKRMDTQLAISGFQQIPQTEAIPQGAIKVGNKFYKKVAPEYNKVEIDGVPYTYEKGGRLYPLNSKKEDTKQPSSFIQKYLLAKEQGFAGSIMDYEIELAKQKASLWKASTPKDPSIQTKTKKFVGPGGKPMAQDYTLDRKTGRWVVARDEEGNPMPAYEVPKTFNLLESLVGGSGKSGRSHRPPGR